MCIYIELEHRQREVEGEGEVGWVEAVISFKMKRREEEGWNKECRYTENVREMV